MGLKNLLKNIWWNLEKRGRSKNVAVYTVPRVRQINKKISRGRLALRAHDFKFC